MTCRAKLCILYDMRMIFNVVQWRGVAVRYSPLINVSEGETCRVARIQAGRTATKRLYEMGFNTGARIEVPITIALV